MLTQGSRIAYSQRRVTTSIATGFPPSILDAKVTNGGRLKPVTSRMLNHTSSDIIQGIRAETKILSATKHSEKVICGTLSDRMWFIANAASCYFY